MAPNRTLVCPACSAPLLPPAGATRVQCTYCGNIVQIPADPHPPAKVVRPPPPPFRPPVVVYSPPVVLEAPTRRLPQPVSRPARRSGSCAGFFFVVALAGIALSVLALLQSDPTFLKRFRGPGSTLPGISVEAQTWGGEGTGPGLFSDATGIAVDSAGVVYVADKDLHRVQQFSADGSYLGGWPINSDQSYGKGQLAADQAGNVYLVWALGIQQYDGATGSLRATFHSVHDSILPDLFDDVAVLPDGSLLAVTQVPDGDLVHFSAKGALLGRIARPVAAQGGTSEVATRLAVDGVGDIFLLGQGSQAVYHFTPEGTFINRFGSPGAGRDQFQTAVNDIAVDQQSRVYVSDWQGIQVFEPSGHYLGRIAKQGTSPHALAIGPDNALYAALGWGKKAQKFVLSSSTPVP